MALTVSGAAIDDRGPAGCVARFLLAGAARDNAGAAAELHPDSLAQISGDVESPPGVIGAEVGEPEDHGDCMWVPTRLVGEEEGSEQRFVFVVHQCDDHWGIHLEQTLTATFGGDPMQMMEDALRTAVAPIGEAFDQMGQAMSSAFGDGSESAPARRITAEETLERSDDGLPTTATVTVIELDHNRRVVRTEDGLSYSTEVQVRCQVELDPQWTATACLGVTLDRAESLDGDDLCPVDASETAGQESYASWERERREVRFRLALAPPPGAFTGLAALAGTVRLALVGGEALEIALGPITELIGRDLSLAALGVTIAIDRDNDGNLVVMAPFGWFDTITELRPIDANGEEVSVSWSGNSDGERDQRTYYSEIPDDGSFLVRFYSQQGTAAIAFACADLPISLA